MASSKLSDTSELSEEWGFHNQSTLEMMIKRSKKLGNGKKKKPSSSERYELFKKAGEKSNPVTSSRRKGVDRKSYFQQNASSLPLDENQGR